VITPEQCAQSIIDDYKMGSQYLSVVSKSIAEQLSEFRASMSEDLPVGSEPVLGSLDDDDVSWWEGWRKRLRTEKGYVKIGKDESSRKRKNNGVAAKKEVSELADITTDIKPMVVDKAADKELRVILKVGNSSLFWELLLIFRRLS
jgi:SWI/SNF-related matrix-associated actin-dependent regulator of chromatin subfamily B protein 1